MTIQSKNFKSAVLIILCAIYLFLILIVLTFYSRIESILYYPLIRPEEWLKIQPYMEINIFGNKIIIIQPSSTFFVYVLGVLTTLFGISLIRMKKNQNSVQWWGIALILWGLGALFAGTSYQAFSYEIKCAGRDYCIWTSWWEIIYLILSVGSVNAMMIAQSYSCTTGKLRRIISSFAYVIFLSYLSIVLIGIIIPIKFMISYKFMFIFLMLIFLSFFFLNSYRYYQYKNHMDLVLLVIWIFLSIIIGIYYIYLLLDISGILWERGIWFSENDVLHIGLIFWMIYIRLNITKYVKDESITFKN